MKVYVLIDTEQNDVKGIFDDLEMAKEHGEKLGEKLVKLDGLYAQWEYDEAGVYGYENPGWHYRDVDRGYDTNARIEVFEMVSR